MSQAASYPCLIRTYETKSVKDFSYIKKPPQTNNTTHSLRKGKSTPGQFQRLDYLFFNIQVTVTIHETTCSQNIFSQWSQTYILFFEGGFCYF